AIDKAVAKDAKMELHLATSKFRLLMGKGGDLEKAIQYGTELTKGTFKDNARGLNDLAAAAVDPDAEEKPAPKLVQFALAAARQADELAKGKDIDIICTLARAHFVSGDTAKAVETQERAVQLASASEEEQMKEKASDLKERLEEYKKAAKK